jgi:hypothetical protein
MKRIAFLIAIILLAGLSTSFGQKPGFFVKCSEAKGDTASKYVKNFERLVGMNLSEAFHCATVHANHQLNARLQWEKEYQLNGGDADFKVCDYLKADYLVLLSMIEGNKNQLQVKATCIDYRNKKNVIASEVLNLTTSLDYTGFAESCRKISDKLIKELGKYEICAFTGPVVLQIKSETDTTITEDYGVYCNGMDQTFHKVTEINNLTESNWKLERKGIQWTEGNMMFNSSEHTSIEENNGCYKCKSGREGGRTLKLEKSFRIQGNGISHESSRNGSPQEDTRIELMFLESGKYIVNIKGTSLPAKGEEKTTESAVGTCDNTTPPPKLLPREISIPINVFFGPYVGKTTDKILSQKDSKTVRNPVTKEKETIAIEFTLNQKEK